MKKALFIILLFLVSVASYADLKYDQFPLCDTSRKNPMMFIGKLELSMIDYFNMRMSKNTDGEKVYVCKNEFGDAYVMHTYAGIVIFGTAILIDPTKSTYARMLRLMKSNGSYIGERKGYVIYNFYDGSGSAALMHGSGVTALMMAVKSMGSRFFLEYIK